MSYHVEYAPAAESFLAGPACSPAMRQVLENSMEEHLGQYGDQLRLTEAYRAVGTSFFEVPLVLYDPDTHAIRQFRIVASDAAAPAGVLRVEYIDEI
jgi:hypothetical protein